MTIIVHIALSEPMTSIDTLTYKVTEGFGTYFSYTGKQKNMNTILNHMISSSLSSLIICDDSTVSFNFLLLSVSTDNHIWFVL